jgi:hypothetical protein
MKLASTCRWPIKTNVNDSGLEYFDFKGCINLQVHWNATRANKRLVLT